MALLENTKVNAAELLTAVANGSQHTGSGKSACFASGTPANRCGRDRGHLKWQPDLCSPVSVIEALHVVECPRLVQYGKARIPTVTFVSPPFRTLALRRRESLGLPTWP